MAHLQPSLGIWLVAMEEWFGLWQTHLCDGKSLTESKIMIWLVVKKHLEKYEFVNGKDYPIYEMEHKKCLKPPTSIVGNMVSG